MVRFTVDITGELLDQASHDNDRKHRTYDGCVGELAGRGLYDARGHVAGRVRILEDQAQKTLELVHVPRIDAHARHHDGLFR